MQKTYDEPLLSFFGLRCIISYPLPHVMIDLQWLNGVGYSV